MNIEFLEEFISQIEELNKRSTNSILKSVISHTKNLVEYGEYGIALENLLDNLYEESIFLDEEIVDLARQAFGKTITTEQELFLKMLTK